MLQIIHKKIKDILINFQSISLLLARLIVAYVFFEPAKAKWSDINAIAEWFGSMGMPFPTLNAYMARSFRSSVVNIRSIYSTYLYSSYGCYGGCHCNGTPSSWF